MVPKVGSTRLVYKTYKSRFQVAKVYSHPMYYSLAFWRDTVVKSHRKSSGRYSYIRDYDLWLSGFQRTSCRGITVILVEHSCSVGQTDVQRQYPGRMLVEALRAGK